MGEDEDAVAELDDACPQPEGGREARHDRVPARHRLDVVALAPGAATVGGAADVGPALGEVAGVLVRGDGPLPPGVLSHLVVTAGGRVRLQLLVDLTRDEVAAGHGDQEGAVAEQGQVLVADGPGVEDLGLRPGVPFIGGPDDAGLDGGMAVSAGAGTAEGDHYLVVGVDDDAWAGAAVPSLVAIDVDVPDFPECSHRSPPAECWPDDTTFPTGALATQAGPPVPRRPLKEMKLGVGFTVATCLRGVCEALQITF